MIQEIKQCTRCKADKPVGEFSKCSSAKDGLQYKCKACGHELYVAGNGLSKSKARYHANPEPARAASRAYAAAHRPERTAYGRAWTARNREYVNARANARTARKSLERQQQKLAERTQGLAAMRQDKGIRKWESPSIQ